MQTARALSQQFSIGHTTIQIEVSADAVCVLAPDNVL
jgi:hypothetical protein